MRLKVIYNLETYDVTTIRASTPMWLMARVIKSMGIKMVPSGEGADELFEVIYISTKRQTHVNSMKKMYVN
jgi:asparagine synthetase B (glutamine-hydrolysing)